MFLLGLVGLPSGTKTKEMFLLQRRRRWWRQVTRRFRKLRVSIGEEEKEK
jgi:hypothetical protein